jgi:hypothetical protein
MTNNVNLFGKGPSITQRPDSGAVIAINDAVYATTEEHDVTFVRCDYGSPDVLRNLPDHVRKVYLWDGLSQYKLYRDRGVTYFSVGDIGLPKRLCTLWMTIALCHKLETGPLNMWGFDHLAGKSDQYGPYKNKNNLIALQDQRPTSWYLTHDMLRGHMLMPWKLPLGDVLLPCRKGGYTLQLDSQRFEWVVYRDQKKLTTVSLEFVTRNPNWLGDIHAN